MTLRRVRYSAAAFAGLTAAVYFLIALRVLTVLDDGLKDQTIVGIMAGLGFSLGVVLLLPSKSRLYLLMSSRKSHGGAL